MSDAVSDTASRVTDFPVIPILLNVHAGATHASLGPEQLRRMALDAGFCAEVIQTRSPDEMRAVVRRLVAAGTPRIGVAGGDGTVRAAVQELAHTTTALGILVQGTFNNFATALRVPQNLPAALKTLVNGTPCPVDLGRIGNRYFTESAGVGLFADGLAKLGEQHHKNIFRAAYVAARLALGLRQQHLRLTIDGEIREFVGVWCEVANTYRIGTGLPIAPEAEVGDGALDIVLFGPILRGEVLEYMSALRAQLHLDLPNVAMLRAAREVRIESRRRLNVHCDDEIIGTTPVTITLEPGALQVLVDETR